MMEKLRTRYRSLGPDGVVAFWLGLWWLLNLVQAGCTELANDEAYYHMFAERLSWGYFDHPPMTALLVWLGERLFGVTELGVRFFFTLLQPLYLFLFWRLIRPEAPSRRDATLYVMLSAATLMLQLYGFIAVPDGPLMFTTALYLLFFKRFNEGSRGAWLWLGVAMAAMAYSKYHGALVVLFSLAVCPRMLLRPRFYLGCMVALLLFVPHLLWQYDNDWASFAYHLSGRNRAFRLSYVVEYLLNILVVFNPLFVPLYIKSWRAVKPSDAVGRALRWMPPMFIGFFLLTTLRGYVQPQWVIAATFGILYVTFLYARRHPRTRRYLMRAGAVTLALIALVRLEMLFNPLGLRFEVFDNGESYGRIAELADGRPVIFRGSYARAAKYGFYTGGEAYGQPNVYYRTSQWALRNDDDRFDGRSVLVECPASLVGNDTVFRSVALPNGSRFNYYVEEEFHPVRRVDIATEGIPERALPGDTLRLALRLHNPYGRAVDIDGDSTRLVVALREGRNAMEYATPLRLRLEAGGEARVRYDFVLPDSLAGRRFDVGFSLRRGEQAYWFNGKSHRMEVGAL